MAGEDLTGLLDAYLETLAACGRGERDPAALVEFFALPALVSTEDIAVLLAEENDVHEWAQAQVDGMRAADFDHIDVLDRSLEPLNARTALVRGAFARRRSDGSEISRLAATYLIAARGDDRGIAALIVHSAAPPASAP